MKPKSIQNQTFIQRGRIYAVALAAFAALAAGTPAHAQWLVQDNNLYKQIEISGNGKGSFKTTSRSVKSTVKNTVKSALGGNKFEELAFDTEDLLQGNKEDPAVALEAMMTTSSIAGGVGAKAVGAVNSAIMGTNTYSSDAGSFFGSSLPACSAKSTRAVFVQCMHMRNILGSQLKEIQAISKTLEERNIALQGIMSERFSTAGELQKKQYEISVLQTVIANDQMRLQTALASYQAMRDMYKEKYNEALISRQSGTNRSLEDNLRVAAGVAAGVASFQATKAAADSQANANIFKKR